MGAGRGGASFGDGMAREFSGDPFDGGEFGRQVFAGDLGVVGGLHVDEDHVAQTEGALEPQGSVGGDRPFPMHDLVDTPGRHIDRLGDPILRNAHRFEEFARERSPLDEWV